MKNIPIYFFLNKKLHKKLRVIKSENILVAWNYPDEQRTHYEYSLVRSKFQMAYKAEQVCELLGITIKKLTMWLRTNVIEHPSGRSYRIHNRLPSTHYWSEDDVLDLRDQIYDLAPKNKYGEPARLFNLISRAELLAKMRGDSSYYVIDESSGKYIKVWKA